MCITLAGAALATSIAGVAVSTVGAVAAPFRKASRPRFNRRSRKTIRSSTSRTPLTPVRRVNAQVTASQMKQRQITSQVGADLAANGLDINTGSPSDVRTATAESGQLNTETTAQNAALQVYGYKAGASNFAGQSNLYSSQASQAPFSAAIGGGGTLLNGGGSLASKWAAWQLQSGSSGGSAFGGASSDASNPSTYG